MSAQYPLQDRFESWRSSSAPGTQGSLVNALNAAGGTANVSLRGRVWTLGVDANGRDVTMKATFSVYDDKGMLPI